MPKIEFESIIPYEHCFSSGADEASECLKSEINDHKEEHGRN